jgi:hypothetical protein
MKRLLKNILIGFFPLLLVATPMYGQGQTFSYGLGLARDYPNRVQAAQLDDFFTGYLHADYFPTDHLPFGLTFKFNAGQHTNYLQRINVDSANQTGNDIIVRGNMSRYTAGLKLAFHESEFTWNPYFSPRLILVRSVSRLSMGAFESKDSSGTTITDREKMHSSSALLYGFEAGIVFTPLVERQKLHNKRCFFSLLFSAEYQRSFGSFEYQTLNGAFVNKNAPADFEFIKEEYRKNAVLNSGAFSTWQFSAGILIKIRFLPV